MRITRRECFPLFGSALTSFVPLRKSLAQEPSFPRLSRGVNVHHMLNWPDVVRRGNETRYIWPPFADPGYGMADEELLQLSRLGFDFIRLTVDPSIFVTADGKRFDELIRHAKGVAHRFIDAGFKLIFDLHPVAVNPKYAPEKLVEDHSGVFPAYIACVQKIAHALEDMPHDRFAFELMNEPWLDTPAQMARWQGMLEKLHAAARRGAPTLPLVLTGAQWSSARALTRVDPAPFKGSNVIYTFHYYDPHLFTHQGVDGDETKFVGGLKWPSTPQNVAECKAAASSRIDDFARKNAASASDYRAKTMLALDEYAQSRPDFVQMRADFDAVAEWAERAGVSRERILLGEFGCTSSAQGVPLGEDRANWLSAVAGLAKKFGFPTAYWAYKGYGGMGLFEGGRIDAEAIKALNAAR